MLLGRSAEINRIDALLADVRAGQGMTLRIVGERGIGKTSMLDTIARRAAQKQMRVIRVRAVPAGPAAPCFLVPDLLRRLHTPRPGYREQSRSPAATASMSLEGLAEALVEPLIAGANEDAPLVVLVDDISDADAGSREAVALAAGRATGVALAVVVTDLPVNRSGSCLVAWPCMALGALDAGSAEALVRNVLGPLAAPSAIEGIVTRLGGNPAALVHAAQQVSPEQAAGRNPLPDPLAVAPALRQTWLSVYEQLPVQTREALLHLIVAGSGPQPLLGAVLTAAGYDMADLDAAERAGMVMCDLDAGTILPQPVARAVVLAETPVSRVRAVHSLVARVSADLGSPPGTVIDHLLAAAVGPDAESAQFLWDQADRAIAAKDLAAAARAREASARLSPDLAVKTLRAAGALRERVIYSTDLSGDRTLLNLVADLPLPRPDSGWVAVLSACVRTHLAASLADLQTALSVARIEHADLLPNLLWEAAETAWALGEPRAAMDTVEEYLVSERAGHPSGCSHPAWTGTALQSAGLFQLGEVARAVALRRRALAWADDLVAASCPMNTLLDAVCLDDLLLAQTPGAEDRLAVALTRTCAPGMEPESCLWGIHAWRSRAKGQWTEALQMLDVGLAVALTHRAPHTISGLLALSTELAGLMGDLARLHADGEASRQVGLTLGDRRRLLVGERALGMVALVRGELDTAAAHLQQVADAPFLGRGLRDAVIASRVDLVEVMSRTGQLAEARTRREAVHPILAAMDEPLAEAWDARAAALVSGDTEADTYFERAIAAHGQTQDPFEEGRTELLYGEHLRRTRRRAEARRHLTRAQALFQQLEASVWCRRAARELRVAGGGNRSVGPWARMTPQERNVAEAAIAGHNTREMADLLVLSPRTIETHLSNLYRKFGVTGRSGLVAALTGAGRHDGVEGRHEGTSPGMQT